MRDGKLSPKEKAFALAYVELKGTMLQLRQVIVKTVWSYSIKVAKKLKYKLEVNRLTNKLEERSIVTRE